MPALTTGRDRADGGPTHGPAALGRTASSITTSGRATSLAGSVTTSASGSLSLDTDETDLAVWLDTEADGLSRSVQVVGGDVTGGSVRISLRTNEMAAEGVFLNAV